MLSVSVLERDSCVRVWLGRVGDCGIFAFPIFLKFVSEGLRDDSVLCGKSPGELVEFQLANMSDPREHFRILSVAQSWLDRQHLRKSTKATRFTYIRSFFMHNRVELPADRGFRFKSDMPPVEGKLGLEDLHRIILHCNPMYKTMFLMMFQSLSDEERFCYINVHHWEEILEHLTKNDGEFALYLLGRKEGKPFRTVFSTHGDWAKALKEYLRATGQPIAGCLFRNEHGKPITPQNLRYYFNAHAVRCGVVKQFTYCCEKCGGETVKVKRSHSKFGIRKTAYVCKLCGMVVFAHDLKECNANVRYGVSPHEMRDLARTRWESSGANPNVAEFIMGHNVDQNDYLKWMKYEQTYPLKEYRKALPYLNILSCDPDKIDKNQVDVQFESQKVQIESLSSQVAVLRSRQKFFDDPKVWKWLEVKLREDKIIE